MFQKQKLEFLLNFQGAKILNLMTLPRSESVTVLEYAMCTMTLYKKKVSLRSRLFFF